MAYDPYGNGWVESYLSALLSGGLSSEYTGVVKSGTELIKEPQSEVSRRYYVSQLLREGELALHHTWRRATCSSNNPDSNDPRVAYLAWRVWFMKRALQKREQLQDTSHEELSDDDDAVDSDDLSLLRQQMSARPPAPPVTPPQIESDSAKNIEAKQAEELAKPAGGADSEEKPVSDNGKSLPPTFAPEDGRLTSSPYLDADNDMFIREPPAVNYMDDLTQNPDGLYIVLLSVHGLVRGKKMELGRDPDTGGQVKYVVEFAKALSQVKPVYRVDLITRLVDDPKVDDSYARPLERIASGEDENGGAFIVRLPCGPNNAYISKEALWPHVRELADHAIDHVSATLRDVKANRRCELFAIHGHYADAGDIASMMCATLGVDMLFTGHSLGRNKLNHLLKSGTSRAEIEETYRISRRIEGEERALDSALMVVSSTTEEVDRQWGLYHGYNSRLEAALRYRKMVSRHVPRICVIPPGLDFSDARHVPASVKQLSQGDLSEISSSCSSSGKPAASVSSEELSAPAGVEEEVATQPTYWPNFFRFLTNPHKPAILAMSRPDAKKNILTLVKAFGENPVLRDICNLVLVMGNRDDIDGMASSGSANVLTSVLKTIDALDLYGSVAYPKRHAQTDISDIYHLPYKTRGVFANVALQEPFGLTIIEAAAHGVPVVATKWGGPTDILTTLKNGVLVEPTNSDGIAKAILNIVTHQDTWHTMSSNGLANVHAYTWPAHCRSALSAVQRSKWLQAAKWPQDGKKAPPTEDHPSTLFYNDGDKERSSRFKPAGKDSGRRSWEYDVGRKTSNGDNNSGAAKGYEEDSASNQSNGTHATKRTVPPTAAALERLTGSSNPSVSESDTVGMSSASSAPLLLKSPSARDRADRAKALSDLNRLVVVLMDDAGGADLVAATVKSLRQQEHQKCTTTAIAIASFLDLSAARNALAKAGVDEKRDHLVAMITRGGAELWTWNVKAAEWEANEAYARHIDFRWDAVTTKRSLTWLKNRATGKSSVSGKSRGGWLAALRRWAGGDESHFEVVRSGEHDHHLWLPAAKNGSSLVAPEEMGDSGEAKHDNRLLAEDIRGKLRGKGVRVNLALSYAEGGDGTWHITPLRATRALAARYLTAVHFGLPLTSLATIAEVAEIQDGTIASACSDIGDIVGGLQRVLLARRRSGLPGEFPTPVSAYGDRITTVSEVKHVPATLDDFLCTFIDCEDSTDPSRLSKAEATDEQSE